MLMKSTLIVAFLTLSQLFAQENPNQTINKKGNKSMDNINDIAVLDMDNKQIKLSLQ